MKNTYTWDEMMGIIDNELRKQSFWWQIYCIISFIFGALLGVAL